MDNLLDILMSYQREDGLFNFTSNPYGVVSGEFTMQAYATLVAAGRTSEANEVLQAAIDSGLIVKDNQGIYVKYTTDQYNGLNREYTEIPVYSDVSLAATSWLNFALQQNGTGNIFDMFVGSTEEYKVIQLNVRNANSMSEVSKLSAKIATLYKEGKITKQQRDALYTIVKQKVFELDMKDGSPVRQSIFANSVETKAGMILVGYRNINVETGEIEKDSAYKGRIENVIEQGFNVAEFLATDEANVARIQEILNMDISDDEKYQMLLDENLTTRVLINQLKSKISNLNTTLGTDIFNLGKIQEVIYVKQGAHEWYNSEVMNAVLQQLNTFVGIDGFFTGDFILSTFKNTLTAKPDQSDTLQTLSVRYAQKILGSDTLIKNILAREDITSAQKAQAIARIISRADSNDSIKSLLRTIFKSDLSIEDKFLILEAAFDARIALPKNSNTDINYIISDIEQMLKEGMFLDESLTPAQQQILLNLLEKAYSRRMIVAQSKNRILYFDDKKYFIDVITDNKYLTQTQKNTLIEQYYERYIDLSYNANSDINTNLKTYEKILEEINSNSSLTTKQKEILLGLIQNKIAAVISSLIGNGRNINTVKAYCPSIYDAYKKGLITLDQADALFEQAQEKVFELDWNYIPNNVLTNYNGKFVRFVMLKAGKTAYRTIDDKGVMQSGDAYGNFLKQVMSEQGLTKDVMNAELRQSAITVFKNFFGFEPTEEQITMMLKTDILITDDMNNIDETWGQRAFDSLFYTENNVKKMIAFIQDSDMTETEKEEMISKIGEHYYGVFIYRLNNVISSNGELNELKSQVNNSKILTDVQKADLGVLITFLSTPMPTLIKNIPGVIGTPKLISESRLNYQVTIQVKRAD
ncbi:MAG: hypothetical protein IKN42_06195, partial [Elusimicrobia bacterium]|nr:hypothetical protein [Elusimicrobiota bacterium]